MRSLRAVGAVGALLVGMVVTSTAATGAASLFQPPVRVDAGVNGPWMPGFPVKNLDGSGGLDLAVIGCEQNQFGNTTGCPGDPTLSILSGDGAGNFSVRQRIQAGTYPTDVTNGNFDSDGLLDLAVTDPHSASATDPGTLYIYGQRDDHSFGRRQTYTLGGPQPKGVQSADLNRDGKADLVVMLGGPTANIQVLLGKGDLKFTALPPFGNCQAAHFFKGFADFNDDGNLDFAVPCVAQEKVAVFLGHGDGTFDQRKVAVPSVSMNAAVGDFDRDGNPDIAVTASPGGVGVVWVFLGDGAGKFAPAPGAPYSVGYSSPNQFTTFLVLGDFATARPDGTHGLGRDGVLDVAVSNSAVNFSSSSVSILVGKGDGSLNNAGDLGSPFDLGQGTGFKTWGLVAGDWNGDNRLDLAVAGGDPQVVPGKLTLLLHS